MKDIREAVVGLLVLLVCAAVCLGAYLIANANWSG